MIAFGLGQVMTCVFGWRIPALLTLTTALSKQGIAAAEEASEPSRANGAKREEEADERWDLNDAAKAAMELESDGSLTQPVSSQEKV